MPTRLHVFDMDGTLLNGAAALELSTFLGRREVGLEIEQLWHAGQITDFDFWSALLDVCEHATEDDLDTAFEQANWLDGITDTFADIRSRGEVAIVISQSPTFFVEKLRNWGAHEAYGSDVVIGQPLSENATLSPEAKVHITRDALERYGISPADCVAYGDSSSDVELFRWLPNTVAVNGNPVVSGLAAVRYQGNDLREAYALGRTLLNARLRPEQAPVRP
ncbi:HAD family hydrolase [Gordonia paraffinivorans]|uniref:HAD family hydrolase n=1 Tax=Gordonia paraffinivorans TaxID=175628 RepID=UPI001E3B6D79|nr:HAD-IB family phosphatase [Gordonia paraffinivorans]MCD2147388.1 HAD-IB family phosphatase [Gordonia paraffinivorans]